jgi:hypothetical protein
MVMMANMTLTARDETRACRKVARYIEELADSLFDVI